MIVFKCFLIAVASGESTPLLEFEGLASVLFPDMAVGSYLFPESTMKKAEMPIIDSAIVDIAVIVAFLLDHIFNMFYCAVPAIGASVSGVADFMIFFEASEISYLMLLMKSQPLPSPEVVIFVMKPSLVSMTDL